MKPEACYTRKYLRGLGNVWRSAADNQGRITLIVEHHFVRLTIKSGLQLSKYGTFLEGHEQKRCAQQKVA